MCENCYHKNNTMRIIGENPAVDQQALSAIDEVMKARPNTTTLITATDMFTLGYIYGKRAERRKRASKKALNE